MNGQTNTRGGGMSAATLTISIPPTEWLTANGRYHWAGRAGNTRALRQRAALLARAQSIAPFGRAAITARIAYNTQRRADPANAAPTVKALIDGLVDAGVLPDDDHRHLPSVTFERDLNSKPPKGWHTVTLTIREAE